MAGELTVTGLVNNFDINSVLQQIQAIKKSADFTPSTKAANCIR